MKEIPAPVPGDTPPEWGTPVPYPPDMRHKLRAFLPDRVTGIQFTQGLLPNGDFAITIDDLHREELTRIERLTPTR